MADSTCSVIEDGTGCPRPAIARGWCNKHYVRWTRTGSPLIVRTQVAANAPCTVDDCDTIAVAKGMCRKHYARMYSRGTLELTRRQFTYTDDLVADYWRLVETHGGDVEPCWHWQGTVSVHGYGVWMKFPAHRYAYTLQHGPVPDLVIDHACHVPTKCSGGPSCLHRRCVNPTHLEAVPQHVNVSRERSSNGRPANDECGVESCTTPYMAAVKGVGPRLCSKHYQRLRRTARVLPDAPMGGEGLFPAAP